MDQDGRLCFHLLSLNIGGIKSNTYKGKEVRSGIEKESVLGKVTLSELGFAGDAQADLVHHGGPDKAVCLYSHNHYPHWEHVLNRQLPFGSFGENFTLRGVSEAEVYIGDEFQAGTSVVQISQPRQPCWKLAMRWGLEQLPLLITESGATGFYFRVIQPGEVQAGDELRLTRRHPDRVTVAEANRVMYTDKHDQDSIRRLLAVNALSASWVATLEKKVD
ncbi:MOSC domain-containing protein [Cohnella kolymensis]|uniref:MOSC domain-containing protein n=1 Tax=Cohnella kolymensis TaxID=1590652 RepID=UPI001F3E2306|nr:MOSC domain-containing protein [Cohnella kolymensis]